MATQNPTLPLGQYVQYNASMDDPNANPPSGPEQTIGKIRQIDQRIDGPYYQVVWNPGDLHPRVAWYHASQLNAINQQDAQQILQQLSTGTYQPPQQQQGSQYQQATLPVTALPPQLQGTGNYSATTPNTPDQATLTQQS